MIREMSMLLGMVLLGCSQINNEDKPNANAQKHKVFMEISLMDSLGVSIRGMDIIKDRIVFSGQSGIVCFVNHPEGTTTKTVVSGAENRDLRDVVQINDSTLICMAIGSPGAMYRSSDSGNSWKQVYHNTDSLCFLDAIKFWNDSMGLAIGDPIDEEMFVLRTKDGGRSWQRLDNLPERLRVENAFAASGTSIAIGSKGKAWIGLGGSEARVLKTIDFGDNWTVTNTPLLSGSAAQGIYSICFNNDNNGIVVGGNWEKHMSDSCLAFTVDGGITWHLPNTSVDGYRSCVTFGGTDEDSFFVSCGTSGLDISLDNGRNWQKLGENNLNVVRFIPQTNVGYAADSKGNIYQLQIKIRTE